MTTSDNDPTPLESIAEALSSGEPVSFNVTVNATPDGGGIAFSGQVAPGQSQPILPPVIVPPIIIPPVPPPVVTPPSGIPPVIPPPDVPPVVPITTPPQFATTTHPIPIPPVLKTSKPYGTNEWWQNIVVGDRTLRIVPEPYQISVVGNGMIVCYPTQDFAQVSDQQLITTQFLQNFTLEFAEPMGAWAITAIDDLTITLKWTAASGQSATSIIAQGCPYMSMAYTGTTPLLTTMHAITSVNSFTAMGPYTGSKFKIALNNGQTWIVYCSSPVTFTWMNSNQIKATAPFTGVIRLACLVNASDEAILDQYVTAIPTGGTVSAQYGSTNIVYRFNWTVAGSGQLLMCALPHHMDIMQSPQKVATSWRSIKGMTTGVVGNSWAMVEPTPTIQWTAPRPINAALLPAIAAQLKKDASFINNSTSDTYFAGKGLAKMARLLIIADEVGDTASVALIAANLKKSLTTWFTQNGLFAYDQTWGGIVYAPSLGDIGSDFGFSYSWNDHVFHLGYFVYACAVLAKFDAAWLAAYQERVTELMHDYCNPLRSSDARYPQIRNKDLYAGHSWAAGLVAFGDNRNLESTSEAINGYYGAMLWGLVTGDTEAQNFGSLMMAMEIRSAQKYWHTYSNHSVYGGQWTANGLGMLWSTKAVDQDWFDPHLSTRRGIQAIPFTPVSELYLEPAWINAMIASGEMNTMRSENLTIWPTFVNGMLAVVDKTTALANIKAMADSQIDDGASRTSLLWWIATRP